METWERVVTVAVVIAVSAVVAKLVDSRMARRPLDPSSVTRYRILRRSIMATIVGVGVLSALLTIPAISSVAGAVLGSAAVIGLVVGFAAQSTLSNFVAGVLIAFTQPIRIGDRVEVTGAVGRVEEIKLTYTFIRLDDGSRLVIPNATLAANTIRNATIVSPEKVAEVTVQVPLSQELRPILASLERELDGAEVYVRSLDGTATVVVREPVASEAAAELRERELRLSVHERLRAEGLFA
ncbi:MAG TPA: mechanosensitive ion channel domain-containing protein [Gaiellaceae bacterium]|nr:mechanosensitive ion channel domain-containing protein [Gaiellaceae bacterium]